MEFVPTEKLTRVINNRYRAILVAAKEARVLNSIAQLTGCGPEERRPKVTSVALDRLIKGQVEVHYSDSESAGAAEGDE